MCLCIRAYKCIWESRNLNVSRSVSVSVHASLFAFVSVSVLVTVYCYFRHPGALPPPSPQLLQLPFCSVIPGTGSLSNPLSPEAEKCHPEEAAQSSIAVVALPLSHHKLLCSSVMIYLRDVLLWRRAKSSVPWSQEASAPFRRRAPCISARASSRGFPASATCGSPGVLV